MRTSAAFLVLLIALPAGALEPPIPLPGLSTGQLSDFNAGVAEWAVGSQFGPYLNDKVCQNCHAKPAVPGGFVQDYNRQGLTGYKPVLDCDRNEIIGGADFNCFRAMFGEDASFDPMKDTVPGDPPEGPILFKRFIGVVGQIVPEVLPAEHPLKGAVEKEHANVLSLRDGPDVMGLGLIEQISTQQIDDACAASGGVVRYDESVPPRPVRFGTQGQMGSTLLQANAEAHLGEAGFYDPTDVDRHSKLVNFMKYLAPYTRQNPVEGNLLTSQNLFIQAGCDGCHTLDPYTIDGGNQIVILSDLCFHDLGPINDDGVLAQPRRSGGAPIEVKSSMWVTPPLWRHGGKRYFMHDGNAFLLRQAVLRHGGEAKDAANHALENWSWNDFLNVGIWLGNGFFDPNDYTAP